MKSVLEPNCRMLGANAIRRLEVIDPKLSVGAKCKMKNEQVNRYLEWLQPQAALLLAVLYNKKVFNSFTAPDHIPSRRLYGLN